MLKKREKNILSVIYILSLMLLLMPLAFAVQIGTGIGIDIVTEDFLPRVFFCDDRILLDDMVEPGRFTPGNNELIERVNNYAFEVEQIQWQVLVWDKNGI